MADSDNVMVAVQEYVQYAKISAEQYKNEFLIYSKDAEEQAAQSLSSFSGSSSNFVNDTNFIGVNQEQFNVGSITDLRTEFDSKYHYLFNTLKQTVPTEFNKFINDFFPTPQNFNQIEQFLVDGITNGTIGLPPEIENQIWQQERERTLLENNKVIMENRKSMASRGFIEPNGVELYREMIIMNQGSKNISASSRQIAIESAKLKIDWIKFAVSEARNYRTLALESAFKYLANILSIQDPSFRYASSYVDSYKTFYDTVNSYYNSVNTINRLNLEKASYLDTKNYNYFKLFQDRLAMIDDQKTKTLTELARSMGSQASAALSGLNSIVQLGSSVVNQNSQ